MRIVLPRAARVEARATRGRRAAGCSGQGYARPRGAWGVRGRGVGAPGMVIRGSSACFEKSTGHFANECMRPRAAGRAFEPAARAKCLVARPLQSGTFDTMPKAAYTRWRFDQHFFKFTHSRSKRPSLSALRPPAACTRPPPAARPPPAPARARHPRPHSLVPLRSLAVLACARHPRPHAPLRPCFSCYRATESRKGI